MAKKVKVELDAAPSSVPVTGVTVWWCRNQQNSRATFLTNKPWGTPPTTLKFNGTCDGLKGRGIVFNSADPSAYCFMRIKREIAEYIGKEYTNGGDIWWTPEGEI